MARKEKKEKPKKRVKVDPNIVDYYALYGLTRGADSKTLVAQLRNKQGEIKQMMSAGSLNSSEVMEKLLEQDKMITAAIRIFKSPEKLEEYNAQLDAAIASGTLDTTAQEAAESAFAEIERLYLNGKYSAVVKMCKSALGENGANAKLYDWMARSYYMMDQGQAAIATVEDFVKAFPKDSGALDLGVRFSILVDNNIDKAQQYANKITELFPGSAVAIADQIYIHLAQRNTEMAFKSIDEYIAANPTDMAFRETVAYDIIGFCSKLYVSVNYEGSDIAYLTSDADYQYCKTLTDKAISIYNDPEIKEYSDYTNYMGEMEFNRDNEPNIIWSSIASLVYLGGAYMGSQMGGDMSEYLFGFIALIVLGFICAFITIMLYQVSKRPYWQIYKYELTGEREPREKVFITIGNLLAGYMKFSFKAAFKIFDWTLRLLQWNG